MTFAPPAAPAGQRYPSKPTRPGTQRRPGKSGRIADLAAVAVGIGLGGSGAVPIAKTTSAALKAAGGWATLLGDICAMTGTYLLLVMVLLAARIPALERVIGQDRLIRWHRLMSSAPLLLLSAHAILTVLGYAQAGHFGFISEYWSLITTMHWIFAAVVAYVMIVAIAGVSIRAVRRRFHYDTWWVIHLYTYLALAFSVPHQIFDGTSFSGPFRPLWILLWLSTAGVVVVYRLGLPVARSFYHRLELVEVRPEAPGVFSIVVRGRHLERLAVEGGQYFGWRFLVRGLWWHAHPFSISALPMPPYMRVTVKVTGDATKAISQLRPGTRIGIEGPYGAFTDASRTRSKVALIGAGVGVTPLRALLEDIPAGVDVVFVERASREGELIHHDELETLVSSRRGRLVTLIGSRAKHSLGDPRYLRRVIPDLVGRDVYVCGPEAFSAGVVDAAASLGVPRDHIHFESFAL